MMATKLTALLGCRYPIIQTAMGWVSDPVLTAATSNAGGFGFLAGATIPADKMEANILETKALTDKGFGVNFHMYQPNARDIVELVIKHKIKAVSYSRSPGPSMIEKLKKAGVICMPTVGHVKHAKKALLLGADAITIQGSEGGGHTGATPTSMLVPEIVDALSGKVPLAAAGGFKDGRGLVAALSYGADGIAMGTRFLLTKESPVPYATKKAYLDCTDPSLIITSKKVDGIPQRMIQNEFLTLLEQSSLLSKVKFLMQSSLEYKSFTGESTLKLFKSLCSMLLNNDQKRLTAFMAAGAPMFIQKAMVKGHPQKGILPSGQVAATINDLPSCHDLLFAIAHEAEATLRQLSNLSWGSIHVSAKSPQKDIPPASMIYNKEPSYEKTL